MGMTRRAFILVSHLLVQQPFIEKMDRLRVLLIMLMVCNVGKSETGASMESLSWMRKLKMEPFTVL